MQQIGNKFVVTFEIEIADVKKNHAITRIDSLTQNFNGTPVPLR